jgi:cob(I)alamin adenosyltransferase
MEMSFNSGSATAAPVKVGFRSPNVIAAPKLPGCALSLPDYRGHIDRHTAGTIQSRKGAMKIYTRTGDQGDTGLFGGGRVPKHHPRVAAYGDVDELNSILGVVRATRPADWFEPLLESIQRDLFSIGGQLATPDPAAVAKALAKAKLSEERVSEFERLIDEADAELPPLRAFILPAGTAKAATLHLARTVCRRAERSVVALAQDSPVPELFVTYLNRLSDLLFILARLANHREGVGDVTW